MSDPDNFLARWSRRKRQVNDSEGAKAQPPAADPAMPDDAAAKPAPPQASAPKEPLVDLSHLPTLDTITADTDIRPFLAPGVPSELAREALRRAWAADPKVRDFVGLADYDFDFHTPGALPGFGPLEMTDEVRRVVARILGSGPPQIGAGEVTKTVQAGESLDEPTSAAPDHSGRPSQESAVNKLAAMGPVERQNSSGRDHAALHSPESEEIKGSMVRSRHGGALPQ